jgi:hypothetical protein
MYTFKRVYIFRTDVGTDLKTDSFCVTNFCFLHLFTDLYFHKSGKKPTHLARYVHIEVAAYSRLAKVTLRINFLR